MSSPDITLYTAATPNGEKISIALEELGLPYKVRAIAFSKLEQKEPWFLEINPNGRIPALTDGEINVWESGSMFQYLVEKYDKEHKLSYPIGSRGWVETNNWLFFQHGGIGPMQGQANHFFRYAPEKIQYGIDRYQNETRRLYSVLETRLASSEYLAGDKVTVADIANWTWIKSARWAGVDIDEFPHLKAWREKLAERPAFKKGINVPPREPSKLDDEARAKEASNWIMTEQARNAKKELTGKLS